MTDTQLILSSTDSASELNILRPGIGMTRMEEHASWSILSRLPVLLTVRIAINRFEVRDLLALEPGDVLATKWSQTRDVPLAVGEVRLGWSEFEVSGQRIGVRLTQLA